MGQVIVKVNGRAFPLTCDDGQEPRIRRLAQYVDAKVGEFVRRRRPGRRSAAAAARRAGHRRRAVGRQRGAAAGAQPQRAPPAAGVPRRRRRPRHAQHGRAHRVYCGAHRDTLALRCGVGLRGALGRIIPRGRYLPLGSCPCRSRGFDTWRPPATAGHGGFATPTAEAAPPRSFASASARLRSVRRS